jgi:hypothetical protein
MGILDLFRLHVGFTVRGEIPSTRLGCLFLYTIADHCSLAAYILYWIITIMHACFLRKRHGSVICSTLWNPDASPMGFIFGTTKLGLCLAKIPSGRKCGLVLSGESLHSPTSSFRADFGVGRAALAHLGVRGFPGLKDENGSPGPDLPVMSFQNIELSRDSLTQRSSVWKVLVRVPRPGMVMST